jgi:hypothetical protein
MMCKEWKSSSWTSISKHGVSFCDKCGNYYERIGNDWEPYSQSKIILCFFLIGESGSQLGVEVLVGGGRGIEEKFVKTSWNKKLFRLKGKNVDAPRCYCL